MVEITNFMHCETIQQTPCSIGSNRQETHYINPISEIIVPFLPSLYSLSVTIGIRGFKIDTMPLIRYRLIDSNSIEVVDTKDIMVPTINTADTNVHALQCNFDFKNIELNEAGRYIAEVYLDKEKVGSYGIDVIVEPNK